jgi:DnaK suppressor protein
MKKELIKKFKEILEKEKEKIEEELKKFAQKGKIPEDWEAKFPHYDGESGSGSLERASDEVEEYEVLRSIEQNLEVKLRDINLALEKIKKGNYGICEKCKKEIELKRLEAIPETRFCKNCKK